MDTMIALPALSREAELRAQSFNEEKRTIDMVWTSGATVRRRSWIDGPYDEELIVSGNAVRLDRLNAGAPFLNTHDAYDLAGVIGSVVPRSARIEKGVGVCTVQLSRREEVAGIVQDIRDGIISSTSVGYRVHAIEKLERGDGMVPLWRITDWEPLEISAVPVPADPAAKMRADDRTQTFSARMIIPHSRALNASKRMRMHARELGLTQ